MARPAVGEESLYNGENTPGWANDIKKYLETCDLPPSTEEVRKLKSRATRFTIIPDYFTGEVSPTHCCDA